MNNPLLLRLLLLSTCGASLVSGALTISVADLQANGTIDSITADLADVIGTTVVTPSTTAAGSTNISTQTMQFDVSGLTIDGVGSGDDSVSFSVVIDAWGVSIDPATPSMTLDTAYAFSIDNGSRWGNTGSLPGGGAFSSSTMLTAGEALAFSYGGGSVSLGAGGSGNYEVTLGSFDVINYSVRSTISNADATVLLLDGVATNMADSTSSHDEVLGGVQSFAIGASEGGFRLNNLDFSVQISAVPEPSAAVAIFGAVGLLVLGMRRRIV